MMCFHIAFKDAMKHQILMVLRTCMWTEFYRVFGNWRGETAKVIK
jgi:hypothetical protein